MLDVPGLGKKLAAAGRLKLRPLCVYGAEEVPGGAVASYAVDRCIAKAVYTSALYDRTPPSSSRPGTRHAAWAAVCGWGSPGPTRSSSTS